MFPPAVHRIGTLFAQHGHQVRVVGGWIRDYLRGIQPKDLDLATTALPDQVIAMCDAAGLPYVAGGIKHGTIGIIIDHEMFEVTTLRVDVTTDGRHAEVEFTTDWQRDAQRRDFTINAMSMSLDGELFDYFGGREHITERRVIFVGDPAARLAEDHLRLLRYFRFRDRMNAQGADIWDLRHVLREAAKGLQAISGERIWMEMSKILSGHHLAHSLDDMFSVRLFEHIGLTEMSSIFDHVSPDREGATHWTGPVFPRAVNARAATDNPITVLAALTSDKTIEQRWKLSRDERLLLHWLQDHRDQTPTLAELKAVATSPIGKSYAVEWAALHGPSEILDMIRAWEVPVFPVQGRDMIGLGIKPGTEMGIKLKLLEQRWRNSDYRLTREQLVEAEDA